MKTFNCAQGSPEWFDLRCGIVTASRMGEVMTAKTMKLSASATPLACELIAEKFLGGPDPWKSEGETVDMRRGSYTEGEARSFIQFVRNIEIQQVGFCRHDNGLWGCSPDGLIGDDEGLELKCPAPKTQVKWLVDGVLPADHLCQVHGCMIVTGRPRWTFMSYCVGLPALIVTVEQDDYTKRLHEALIEFSALYVKLLAKVEAQRDQHIDIAIQQKGDQFDEKKDKPLLSFV